jgi:hypothetical protein
MSELPFWEQEKKLAHMEIFNSIFCLVGFCNINKERPGYNQARQEIKVFWQ